MNFLPSCCHPFHSGTKETKVRQLLEIVHMQLHLNSESHPFHYKGVSSLLWVQSDEHSQSGLQHAYGNEQHWLSILSQKSGLLYSGSVGAILLHTGALPNLLPSHTHWQWANRGPDYAQTRQRNTVYLPNYPQTQIGHTFTTMAAITTFNLVCLPPS